MPLWKGRRTSELFRYVAQMSWIVVYSTHFLVQYYKAINIQIAKSILNKSVKQLNALALFSGQKLIFTFSDVTF